MIAKVPATADHRTFMGRLSPGAFAVNFNRQPFVIQHELEDHELFDLGALVDLSRQLPATSVEYNSGDLPVSQDPDRTPMNGLSHDETIRRIQECRSWLVLKNVEQHPAYCRLLDQCLDEIQSVSEKIAPGMTQREGFIFISSPGSVTPYHIDPENNFLLQVRGQKQVHMYDPLDREVISEQAIEDFFAGAHRNLEFHEALHGRGHWFNLKPGQALHFPVVAPHWVQNGDQVSVSFSITFQTDDSMRRQTLHRFNRRMRRWGLTPTPVGFNAVRDNAKYFLVNAVRQSSRVWRWQKSEAR
ncbi:MAG: cupin-like domain-containing protein [Pirellulaceae bacterium]